MSAAVSTSTLWQSIRIKLLSDIFVSVRYCPTLDITQGYCNRSVIDEAKILLCKLGCPMILKCTGPLSELSAIFVGGWRWASIIFPRLAFSTIDLENTMNLWSRANVIVDWPCRNS